MSVDITYLLGPTVAALLGLVIAQLLRIPGRARVIGGLLGIAVGIALECWLFFRLIPDNRAHGCRYDPGLTDAVFWTSFYLSAFASGVAASAAKVPSWVSVLF